MNRALCEKQPRTICMSISGQTFCSGVKQPNLPEIEPVQTASVLSK